MRIIAGLALFVSILVSCAQEPAQQTEWTPEIRLSPGHHSHLRRWIPPLEMQFKGSDVVARVRLDGIEERVSKVDARTYSKSWLASIDPEGETIYMPVLYYRFEVLEYFRGGTGSEMIWGYAMLSGAESESEEEAAAAFPSHSERRDNRWDDHEAVVFLYGSREHDPSWVYAPEDHYQLGWTEVAWRDSPFFQEWGLYESYTLQGMGGWFPSESRSSGSLSSASSSGGASAWSGEQQFILSERSGDGVSAASGASVASASGASDVETVELSELRRLGAMSDEEIEAELVEKEDRIYLDRLADMDLTASASENTVTLRWQKDNYIRDGAVRYRILRRAQDEQEFVHVADIPHRGDPVPSDIVNFSDVQYEYVDSDGLTPGTSYLYVVRAAVDRLNIDNVDASVEVVTDGASIEEATQTPEPEPEPTAEPTATPEPTVTPEATPTAEPTVTPEATPTAEPTVESTPVLMPTETSVATPVPAEDDDSTDSSAPPPAPQNLTAAVNEDGTVTLSWDAPEDEAIESYQILRQRPTEGEEELSVYVEDTGSADTSYIDVEVTAAVRHIYQVRAISAAGTSELSNSVQVGP